MDGEPSDLQGEQIDVAFFGYLSKAALNGFLSSSKSEGLPEKQARRAVARIREIRLLRFAVGEAGRTGGVVQSEALQQLGIVIELAPVPESQAQKCASGPGGASLCPGREAVLADIRRAKRGIALLDVRGLGVDFPDVGPGRRRAGGTAAGAPSL